MGLAMGGHHLIENCDSVNLLIYRGLLLLIGFLFTRVGLTLRLLLLSLVLSDLPCDPELLSIMELAVEALANDPGVCKHEGCDDNEETGDDE